MDHSQAIDVLNRLLQTLYRSLPMYLQGRRVWAGAPPLRDALADLIADQQHYVDRIGQLIYEWDGRVAPAQFPLDFTSLNDVSLDWLWNRIVDDQQQALAAIQRCVQQLSDSPRALSLAQEILGNARGHLLTLEEIVAAREPVNG